MDKKQILVVAGEPSGDERAAELVTDILKLRSDLHFFGMGGEKLREAGVEILVDIKETAIFGILEALTQIQKFKKIMAALLAEVEKRNAHESLLVDFGGFNLRLAAKLKKAGVKTGYFVSPQVWASRPGRARKVRDHVDLMMVLFDFEKDFYKNWNVDAVHVGHPLLDTVKAEIPRVEFFKKYQLNASEKLISIMPGSRPSEINKLLTSFLDTVAELATGGYHQFVFIAAPGMKEILEKETHSLPVKVIDQDKYSALAASDLVLLTSGTAALEVALLEVPAIVVYKTSRVTAFLAKFLMNVKYVSLPNIIMGEMLYPELLQKECRVERIVEESLAILEDIDLCGKIRSQLKIIKTKLGQPGAIKNAAKQYVTFLEQ
jgi:lipid-A-disaccharide synthase